MRCDSKDWNVTLVPAKCINIYDVLKSLESHLRELFYAIKSKPDSKQIQDEFNAINAEVNSINRIFEEQSGILKELNHEKTRIFTEITQLGLDKKKYYDAIKNPELIGHLNRSKLMAIYKHEGILNDKRLSQVSKELSLDAEDILNWLNWVKVSHDYMLKQIELNNIVVKIGNVNQDNHKHNNFFMIQYPSIIMKKTVRMDLPSKKTSQKKKEGVVEEPVVEEPVVEEKEDVNLGTIINENKNNKTIKVDMSDVVSEIPKKENKKKRRVIIRKKNK